MVFGNVLILKGSAEISIYFHASHVSKSRVSSHVCRSNRERAMGEIQLLGKCVFSVKSSVQFLLQNIFRNFGFFKTRLRNIPWPVISTSLGTKQNNKTGQHCYSSCRLYKWFNRILIVLSTMILFRFWPKSQNTLSLFFLHLFVKKYQLIYNLYLSINVVCYIRV